MTLCPPALFYNNARGKIGLVGFWDAVAFDEVDEFARINLSYINARGEEVVVYCPESKDAPATQEPVRRGLSRGQEPWAAEAEMPRRPAAAASPAATVAEPQPEPAVADPLKEQHITIAYGDTGHTYDSILGAYLAGARAVTIEDPYIRAPHQIANFVRFCETVVKASTVRRINLKTGYDATTDMAMLEERLSELKQSLLEYDVLLDIELSDKIHDREIAIDNGWVVKIGRGLDFYQKPDGWNAVGANDFSLRRCRETKVDIYRSTQAG